MQADFEIKRRQIVNQLDWPKTLHPVLQRVYAQREIGALHEIEHKLELLHRPETLSGLEQAVSLLQTAVQEQNKILIVGDFDADGATSTALALRALRAMGAKHCDYLVPDRFKYGYGLTAEIVEVAVARQPDLLVTVDNGISSLEGVAAAQAQGIKVIITDHHLPGERLPTADAIVNPNVQQDAFPSKHLAGVGVIFYVMSALRASLNEAGWFTQNNIEMPNLAQYLDLVALGTVADVVPLDHNNRIFVDQGLRRIRAGRCIPAITALLRLGKRSPAQCIATDLGFAAGPRLNAAGRLEDMSLGIECLLSDDSDKVDTLARRLDQLNTERREIEAEMREQAQQTVEQLSAELKREDLPAGLALYDPRWHQGVIGILAARIKEKIHRPVIAFARVSDDEIKGSARSISGVHIRDILDEVATQHPGLITKFGGHAMAAGMSIEADKFKDFAVAFAETVEAHQQQPAGQAIIWSDGELSLKELNLRTAEALRQAGPWGQAFPEPMFDGVFELQEKRIVGESHLKMKVQFPGTVAVLDAIAFNETGEDWNATRLKLAYRLDVNEFRARRTVQLNVQHIQPID